MKRQEGQAREQSISTLKQPESLSLNALLADATDEEIHAFLNSLSPNALASLPWLFEHWALDHQIPPAGKWRNWVLTGGRGAGKTRAGAEWVRSLVEGSRPHDIGRYSRLGLIADTLDQAREVMIFGDSGIMACTPPDRRPKWQASRKTLEWPNGAIAQIFSGSDPESLRGPQFDAAWVDEFAKWKKAEESWDMLQFGMRLGDDPRTLITTTPRSIKILKEIMEDPGTVITRAPTSANMHNLAPGFINALKNRYEGSFLGRQELEGEFVSEVDGALWSFELLEACRKQKPEDLDRIVVAIDPPVTHHNQSDECGIVVAGATYGGADSRSWKAYVLADISLSRARPEEWAAKAVAAYHEYDASAIIAEVNQGGDMVASMIRQIDPMVKFTAVRAKQGKALRAEPISALYAQEKISHCGVFSELEDQMLLMSLTGYQGSGSPDRLDALVWAIHSLLIEPSASHTAPRLRLL